MHLKNWPKYANICAFKLKPLKAYVMIRIDFWNSIWLRLWRKTCFSYFAQPPTYHNLISKRNLRLIVWLSPKSQPRTCLLASRAHISLFENMRLSCTESGQWTTTFVNIRFVSQTAWIFIEMRTFRLQKIFQFVAPAANTSTWVRSMTPIIPGKCFVLGFPSRKPFIISAMFSFVGKIMNRL